MQDTIRLERKGIPTVTLAWDIFEGAARAYAQVANMPSVPIVVFKHWEPGVTSEMARDEAEALADAIFGYLTRAVGERA